MIIDDQFYQATYQPDSWQPKSRHRELKLVKTGTWFFGLFSTYKMKYTDWVEDDRQCRL